MTTQTHTRTTTASAAESLLVTGDESLAALLAPLAAAAGHPLHRVTHAADAESRWQRAPLVIVGADAAASCIDHHLPRRRGLILCTGAPHTGPGDPTDTSALWPLAVRLDADHVIAVPEAGDWLLDRFSRTIRDATPAPVLATVAAHGGAGASTLALAAAATAAARGERVLLIDLDTRAGGIDQAAGLAAQPGWRWPSIGGGRGQIDPERLCTGLPQRTGLHILAPDARRPAPIAPEVVDRVLHAARAAADLVIVDLPRSADPAALHAAAAAGAVAVTVGASPRAWSAARSLVAAYRAHWARPGLILRGPTPPRPAPHGLGGELDELDLPEWGTLPDDPGLAERLRRGRTPTRRTARRLTGVLDALRDAARPTDAPVPTPIGANR